MNINFLRVGAVGASALLLLTGCIDDNYDLSDIDTTTQLKVNDLVIPVNIESITLDNVMDIDEDDPDATIKYVTVGDQRYFAIEKGGDFHANSTSVEVVKADKPSGLTPIEQDLTGEPVTTTSLARKAPGMSMKYVLKKDFTDFTYDIKGVDEAIESVEDIKMLKKIGQEYKPLTIDVELTSPNVLDQAKQVEFFNLYIELPEGMQANCEDGTMEGNILHIPYLIGDRNTAHLTIVANEIDLTKRKDDIKEDGVPGIKIENQSFKYDGEIAILKGELKITAKDNATEIPANIRFIMKYNLSEFTVNEFSGKINYKTEIDNIEPVDLSDLPDFLAGDETNLIMNNPQIMLNVPNPAGKYNLGCFSGLTIKSIREDGSEASETLPNYGKDKYGFSIGYNKGVGPYTVVVAPRPDEAINVTGENRTNYSFPGLSKILSGNGLPQRLEVKLESPSWPEPRVKGDAKDFPLGVELGDIDGSYTFMTLLALDDGSKIVYEKTEDGWNDEDVDAIDISHFTVSATATTDLPCGVTLTARPINVEGKEIPITNPEKATAVLPAYAKNEPFTLTLAGEIRHLDGIRIIAVINDFNGDPLMPAQNIQLNDVRVKVTGTYTKEL